MTKYYYLLMIMLCAGNLTAQHLPVDNTNRIRITDTGQVQLLEILPVKKGPDTDPAAEYYWYSANKVHQTQGGYSGRLLNGSYTAYYLNKELRAQGNFVRGLKKGIWKQWDQQGRLLNYYTWNKGRLSGAFGVYDTTGRIMQEGNYDHGRLEGFLRNYPAADSVQAVYYKNGKQVSAPPPFLKRINIFKRKAARDTSANAL